jgi:hypothetical protein
MPDLPLMANETAVGETPAICATCLIVILGIMGLLLSVKLPSQDDCNERHR